jgi:anaerobic selenocysteine-containing dehydrogenase
MDYSPKLFLATPCYGGLVYATFAESMLQLQNGLLTRGWDAFSSFLSNESLITRGRNSLVNDFLETDCTHLMFIDADIGFQAEDVFRMVEEDVELICGIYPKKQINWDMVRTAIDKKVDNEFLQYFTGAYVVNNKDGVKIDRENKFEINNGGTGFMLIKREVFMKLKDKCPRYTNDMADVNDQTVLGKTIIEYFDTSIDPESNRLLSEDYHFCKLARDNGITVWAAPYARLSHTGTYQFSGRLM